MSVTSEIRDRVDARLKELEPFVQEYDELRRIVAALEENGGSGTSERSPQRSVPRRRMRPAGAGAAGNAARADQALDLVRARPGITVAELAEQMGIGTTYLYRLLPRLDREGLVRKEGRGYHPVEPQRAGRAA